MTLCLISLQKSHFIKGSQRHNRCKGHQRATAPKKKKEQSKNRNKKQSTQTSPHSTKSPDELKPIFAKLSACWYLNLTDFLVAKILCINVKSRKNSFKLDKFRRISQSPPLEVGHLFINLERVPLNYAAFLSGLLSVCRPRILLVEAWNNTDFFQWLYQELRKRDAKCCSSSHSIKCWWHEEGCKMLQFFL